MFVISHVSKCLLAVHLVVVVLVVVLVVVVLVVLVALVVVVLVVVVVVAYGLWDGDEKKVIVFLGVHVRAGAGTGFIKVATLRLQCRYLEAAYQIGS